MTDSISNNESKEVFSLSYREARMFIRRLENDISSIYKIPFQNKPKIMSNVNANIIYNDVTLFPEYIEINTSSINKRFWESRDIMPDKDFINLIWYIYHETDHADQVISFLQNNKNEDEMISYMCMAHIVSLYNDDFYWLNYSYYPTEIHAEYQALLRTRSILIQAFSDIPTRDIETAIINYMNDKAHCKGYHIQLKEGENFSSFEEIEVAFKNELKNSRYHICEDNYLKTFGAETHDESFHFLSVNTKWGGEFQNGRTLEQQVYKLASLTCVLHPELCKQFLVLSDSMTLKKQWGENFHLTDDEQTKFLSYMEYIRHGGKPLMPEDYGMTNVSHFYSSNNLNLDELIKTNSRKTQSPCSQDSHSER